MTYNSSYLELYVCLATLPTKLEVQAQPLTFLSMPCKVPGFFSPFPPLLMTQQVTPPI